MKKGKILHKFPGSNTAEGFHSFYAEGLKPMDKIYVLKGGPGTGKSSLMRKIGAEMADQGYDVELWQCSSDNESLDGVLIRELGVAVVDGTAPHVVDPVYPGAVDQIVNLGDHWNADALRAHRDEIVSLTGQISENFAQAYRALEDYKQQYDNTIGSLTYSNERLQATADDLLSRIFRADEAKISHFFASAVTPKGLVGFGQELTARAKRRYLIAGGNLQSVHSLIAAVAEAAVAHGHSIELYHSTIDPIYYEILVLPDLEVALADSNAAGLISRSGDVLVELQPAEEVGSDPGLKAKLETAVAFIAQAKSLHNDLEEFYIRRHEFS